MSNDQTFLNEIYMMEHKAMFVLGKIKIRQSGTSLHTSGHKATSKCVLLGRVILNHCASAMHYTSCDILFSIPGRQLFQDIR